LRLDVGGEEDEDEEANGWEKQPISKAAAEAMPVGRRAEGGGLHCDDW